MKQRIVFIMNPISGTTNKAGIPELISSTLNQEQFSYEIAMTEYAGHAAEIATRAKDDAVDVVVAIGGDGTVNEVARSIVHSHTALGIIPCGSGNGLARQSAKGYRGDQQLRNTRLRLRNHQRTSVFLHLRNGV